MPKKNKTLRAKLIANPGAGKPSESAAKLLRVTEYLEEFGLKVDVALAHPKIHAIPIAKRAVKEGYDLVISMGCDGTLGMVIRGIAGSKVRLGIIAAGTSNDMARSLGIPEDLKEACALIASGHTRKLDLGQISTSKRKKFYFMMMAAIGLTATIFPMIKGVPNGSYSGLADGIMTFLKFKSKPKVYLTLDNESKIEVETMLVTIANSPLVGVRNLVAPDASMDDGLLDISVYPGFSKAQVLSYFARTANETPVPDGAIQRYRAKNIKVKTSPKLDIAAEGILLGKGSARIKVLPGALRVIAPEPETGTGVEKPPEKVDSKLPKPEPSVSK